ncbi:MAG: hypothetical protein NUV56_04885, partial [Candidatus Uhrbacteria bacterium]|nr:hypothetical protein [Candidatus Uhrbacteria bacterium]
RNGSEFDGDYKAIDIESAIDILPGDKRHRLIAKVQLEDGRWQVADQHGLLGDPGHGIIGLHIYDDGKNTFIRWTARHRRELVDCQVKAF